MTAPLKTIDGSSEIAATMSDIGRRAKAAARVLALAATAQKDRALAGMASAIRAANPRSSPPTPRTWPMAKPQV